MKFFVGLHQPSDARHFGCVCISVNRLRSRKRPMQVGEWMLDSGAFTELSTHGKWRTGIRMYGAELEYGAWVGVGSVCKRNGDPRAIEAVLLAIQAERPDLKLHGFGIKLTALASGLVRRLLHSADSMAWSFSARKQGRNGNDWAEAERFRQNIEIMPFQRPLELLALGIS